MALVALNHKLCEVDEKNKVRGVVCDEFAVVRKEVNLLTGDAVSHLRIWHGNSFRDYAIDRTNLTIRGLQRILLQKNVCIPDDETTLVALCEYAMDTDSIAPTIYFHDRLGFVEINGELVYLSSSPIGDLTADELSSRYADMKSIDPQGDMDSWLQVIKEEVLGRTPLELALAIGASSPILYLLRRDGFFPELPVIALIGESSTGKTTSFRLMGSIDGSPAEGIGRLKDLNSTMNAFFRQMALHQGTTFLFDEATGKGDWTITDVLYSLVKGIERARCKSNGTLNERATFSGTVVLTGETSLLADGKLNGGQLSRCLELTLPWTESKEHSERLNKKLSFHHGWAILPLVHHIMSEYRSNANIFKKMLEDEEKLLMKMKPITKNVEGRIYRVYALLIVSAKIAGEAWGVTLHIDEIRTILLEQHEQNQPVKSQAMSLYDRVLAKVNANISLFPTKETQNFYSLGDDGQTMGMRERKGDTVIIWITKDAFHSFVKDRFPNPSDFFAELAEQDLMVRDIHRHYTFKKRLSVGRCYCYGLKVNTYEEDDPVCLVLPKEKSVYVQEELQIPTNSDFKMAVGEMQDAQFTVTSMLEMEVQAS